MNGRQKIEAAFSPEGTPEFAAVLCYEGIYMRDHWAQLTRQPWWADQSPNLDERMAAWSEIVPAIGQDWMALSACPSRRYREAHAIETGAEGVFRMNRLTGARQRLYEPQVSGWDLVERGYSGHVERLASTPDEIDQLLEPLSRFDPQEFLAQGYADLAQRQLAAFGADHYPICHVSSPLWDCFALWGFEGLMTMVADQPDLVHYACQRYLTRSLYQVHQSAALGARGIWIEECLTDQISPAAYEALNLPYLRAVVDEIRACGMHSIYYYCGNPTRRLDLLLSSGADALALEESKKGFTIDITEIAEAVDGRCVLFGNLDAIQLLPHASEATLRAEIERQLAAGRRNQSRFVMSLGSPVTPETSPERVRQYGEWIHDISKGC